ncbi:MAG: redox-regulated ATPase YchF [Bacteroidetes bacterium]|nr:redox-regulated ATPase YchF [Rhodothermia bacterium]MCX7906132.1 redox-regulated ATPase YchF [Bacteroidota bacterium]
MGLRCGIVGLPNVGKSTLFNALTAAGAEVANYPFCTIEPNVGVVPVPDERLMRLAQWVGPGKVTPATVEIVDIAGLVRGASRGEGLGNQFLAHIREVDAILHVVRCFQDPNVIHVEGEVDPERDIQVVQMELVLKDLETVLRRLERAGKAARMGDKKARLEAALLERLREHLDAARPARTFGATEEEQALLRPLCLLTAKPVLYVANVAEADLPDGGPLVEPVRRMARDEGAEVLVLCAELEAQIARLPASERAAFLQAMGLPKSGLDRLVCAAYALLGLITFFTVGPKEVRAWTIRKGTRAAQAAGKIHSDMEQGFIRAEVTRFADWERLGSEQALREAGLVRIEGRHYEVQDGDILHIRFS